MSRCQQVGRPIALCLRQSLPIQPAGHLVSSRAFSNSTCRRDAEPTTSTPPSSSAQAVHDAVQAGGVPEEVRKEWMNPNTTTLAWAEEKLIRRGVSPIGSRRRRAAVRQTPGIPFEQLPYQCFQEARKILIADREEKIREIQETVHKIKAMQANPANNFRAGPYYKEKVLGSLRRYLERLKIMADINDPLVLKKFEDKRGDLNKPIYRYLLKRKWMSMDYKIIQQRIEQFRIVPDVLPKFNPTAALKVRFRRRYIHPGEILDSLVSETAPKLQCQVFDNQEHMVSVVVMDSDVPVPEEDGFKRRLHFLAANIPINVKQGHINLSELGHRQLAVPWLPAFSQEGAPYHRMSIFLLEQKDGKKIHVDVLKKLYSSRDEFSLKSFRDKFPLTPFAYNIFRTVWDKNTATVMERHGIPGAEIVFRHPRVHALKPPHRKRGWEAKHSGPKYRHLYKYTQRIGRMRPGAR